MESIQYDRFTSSESEIPEHMGPPPSTPNRQDRRIFIMFGVLSLFLLTLTLAVGIKFTQVSMQVSDLMESLDVVSTSIKVLQKGSSTYPELIIPVRGENPHPIVIYILLPLHSIIFNTKCVCVSYKGPCEDDWTFFKDKCYFASKLRKSWEDAEKNCVQRNAHLLVVNDAEEQDYISQVIEMGTNFWIGLVEREEGTWSWVDGTDYTKTKHFWDDGQPDNWDVRLNGEDCGQLHARSQVTHRPWNDADCSLAYKYICEGRPRRHQSHA
ncbi:hepatic lectin-like [Astyanax mexicanus]|uniref:C-type lectin domain family 4 member E n=1 Tax=Astyanax mexicanus TaxID=7994 RepID=A0A8B9J6Y0_ASTMX|nr:hepatic lectin-like [Astyanax mexicanus]